LNRVLNNREGRRVAVIVNDMSEVNIDADLVRADSPLSSEDGPEGNRRSAPARVVTGLLPMPPHRAAVPPPPLRRQKRA